MSFISEHFEPGGFFGAGGVFTTKPFDFDEQSEAGTAWEIRVPGVNAEQTFLSDDNPIDDLEDAVRLALPNFSTYGLTLGKAAELLLQLGIVMGVDAEP